MITWVQLWWLFLVLPVLLFLPGLVPDFEVIGKPVSAESYRLWFINLFAWALPEANAIRFANWFAGAGHTERVVLHGLLAVNVSAMAMPIIYFLGEGAIRFLAFVQKLDHSQRNKLIKR